MELYASLMFDNNQSWDDDCLCLQCFVYIVIYYRKFYEPNKHNFNVLDLKRQSFHISIIQVEQKRIYILKA